MFDGASSTENTLNQTDRSVFIVILPTWLFRFYNNLNADWCFDLSIFIVYYHTITATSSSSQLNKNYKFKVNYIIYYKLKSLKYLILHINHRYCLTFEKERRGSNCLAKGALRQKRSVA